MNPREHLSTMSYLWREYERTPRALAFHAQTQDEWRVWRDALRTKPIECLGGFPIERCDLTPRIVGAQGHSGHGNFPRVIECMADGMDMTPMITKKIRLEQVPENIIGLQTNRSEAKITYVARG